MVEQSSPTCPAKISGTSKRTGNMARAYICTSDRLELALQLWHLPARELGLPKAPKLQDVRTKVQLKGWG
jgi:hypothetical protein